MTTNQKGAIAETAIIHAAAKLGIGVYKPVAICAYCADLDRCYFLPLERFRGHSGICLRLQPTRNDQKLGIHWAEDYEFERLDCAALGP